MNSIETKKLDPKSRANSGTRRPRALVLVALAIIAIVPITAAPAHAYGEKITVAVIDFDTYPVRIGWSYKWRLAEVGTLAADSLTNALASTGTLSVIERARINEILAEQDFQHGGRVDKDTAVQIGKVLGAPLVVVGQLETFTHKKRKAGLFGIKGSLMTTKVEVSARLVNTQTAEILATGKGEGKKQTGGVRMARGTGYESEWDITLLTEVFNEAMEDVAKNLSTNAAKLDPAHFAVCRAGSVIAIEDDKIILNLGREDKAKTGQYYEVRRRGRVYRDQYTGQVLGHADDTIGLVKIVKIAGTHLSHAIAVDGNNFQVSDMVMQSGAPGDTYKCMEPDYRLAPAPRPTGPGGGMAQGSQPVGGGGQGGAPALQPPAHDTASGVAGSGIVANNHRTIGGRGGRAEALQGPSSYSVETMAGRWGIHPDETYDYIRRRADDQPAAKIFGGILSEGTKDDGDDDSAMSEHIRRLKQKIANLKLRIDLNEDETFTMQSFDKGIQAEKWVEGTWKVEGAFAALTGTRIDGRPVENPQTVYFKFANNKLFGQPAENDENDQAARFMLALWLNHFSGTFPNIDGVCLVRV